eukprot:gene10296-2442_t
MASGLQGAFALITLAGTIALTVHGLSLQGPIIAAFLASLFLHLDVFYFTRSFWFFFKHLLDPRPPCDLFEPVDTHCRLWLSDLDWNYPRSCDLARYHLWKRNGVFEALKRLGGYTVLGACGTRFRRSIEPFQYFVLRSQVLCWDEKAFYVEQRFITNDGFVRAIFFAKQAIVKTTTTAILKEMGLEHLKSPKPPTHLEHWINFDKECSRSLRREANLD